MNPIEIVMIDLIVRIETVVMVESIGIGTMKIGMDLITRMKNERRLME